MNMIACEIDVFKCVLRSYKTAALHLKSSASLMNSQSLPKSCRMCTLQQQPVQKLFWLLRLQMGKTKNNHHHLLFGWFSDLVGNKSYAKSAQDLCPEKTLQSADRIKAGKNNYHRNWMTLIPFLRTLLHYIPVLVRRQDIRHPWQWRCSTAWYWWPLLIKRKTRNAGADTYP